MKRLIFYLAAFIDNNSEQSDRLWWAQVGSNPLSITLASKMATPVNRSEQNVVSLRDTFNSSCNSCVSYINKNLVLFEAELKLIEAFMGELKTLIGLTYKNQKEAPALCGTRFN